MKISVSYNVRNEQMFLPYSMMSMQHVADEYVVIDHASTDSTKQMVEQATKLLKQPVHYEYVPEEKGELYTKNLKFKRATGDWVFLLDGDELFAYEWAQVVIDQLPDLHKEGFRGLWLDMVEFMTFDKTCGKVMDRAMGYAGQRQRPRVVKRKCKFQCAGSSWRNNGFFIDGIWHRDDPTWIKANGYIYHYDRLKVGLKERIEKMTTHVQSVHPYMTREQIKQRYILPPDSKYHNNTFLKQEALEFKGIQPEVFQEYHFHDLENMMKNRDKITWCPKASGNLVIEDGNLANEVVARRKKKKRTL